MWLFKKRKHVTPEIKERIVNRYVAVNEQRFFYLVLPENSRYLSRYGDESPSERAYNSEGLSRKVFMTADLAASASQGRFLIKEISLVQVENGKYQRVEFMGPEFHL